MENITIINRGQMIIKRIMGGILIILGIGFLIFERNSLKLSGWLESILFIIWGSLFFTPLLGSGKCYIVSNEDNLKIKWRNWFSEVTIRDTEIEKIILGKVYILIIRKGKKPVNLLLESVEMKQKTQVYEFLIEYARQKNLVLEK